MELFIIVIIAMYLVIMAHSLLTGRLLWFIIMFFLPFVAIFYPFAAHNLGGVKQ